jgi:antitoxin VapB
MKKGTKARVFWSGRSQAVRLPKEYRLTGDTVVVRRVGNTLVLEPADDWPEGYVESFSAVASDFDRPPQGKLERRERLR